MPSITGISHVDLSVTDLATGDGWYRELLGAVPLFDGRNDGVGLDHLAFNVTSRDELDRWLARRRGVTRVGTMTCRNPFGRHRRGDPR